MSNLWMVVQVKKKKYYYFNYIIIYLWNEKGLFKNLFKYKIKHLLQEN